MMHDMMSGGMMWGMGLFGSPRHHRSRARRDRPWKIHLLTPVRRPLRA